MPQSANHTDRPAARRRTPRRTYKILGLALILLALAMALPAGALADPSSADAAASWLEPVFASITANGTSTQVLTVTAKDVNGVDVGTGGDTVLITKTGTGSISGVTNRATAPTPRPSPHRPQPPAPPSWPP